MALDHAINPLIATLKPQSTITPVRWPLMGGLSHLIQQGGDWAGPHPSTASVPASYYSMWHYNAFGV